MDVLLSLREATKVMGVSYTKAQRLAKAGEIPFRKLGSTWVIPRSVLFKELGLQLPPEDVEKETHCA